MHLPALYPILDFSCFADRQDPLTAMLDFAEELLAGGATIIQYRHKQYRDKSSDPRTFLHHARELRSITLGRAPFIVNDRLDLALACGADGVHLGQDDLSPVAARKIFDSLEPHPFPKAENSTASFRERMGHPTESLGKAQLIIGFSTHNLAQVCQADAWPVDYIAVGPVFATASKANADPVIGLDGVRQTRAATTKPLVAIGGITRENCLQVKAAGADSVAVISDLLESPAKAVAAFLRVLG